MQAVNGAVDAFGSTSLSHGNPLTTNAGAETTVPAAVPAASQPLSSRPTSAHISRSSTSHRSISRSSHDSSTPSASSRGNSARPAPDQTQAAPTTTSPPPPAPPAAQATTSSMAAFSSAPPKPLLGLPHQHSRVLRSCKYLLLASSFYALALGVTLTVSSKHTLLGAVSLPAGIFLLNLVSKIGDVAFVLAIGEMFENLLWGRFGKREIVPLTKVLALSGTTGVHGLARIAGERRKLGSTRAWALLRLFGVLVAPGPGLLLMANVNPELYYFPTTVEIENSTLGGPLTVSAGISSFQPSAVITFQEVARKFIPLMVQTLLQNENIAFPADPLSQECRAVGASCSSTILTGGLQNVRPIFNRRTDAPVGFAMVYRVPSYQFDVWPSQVNIRETDCTVYGGSDPRFQLCIAAQEDVVGQLQVSWRSCPVNRAGPLFDPPPDPTFCASEPTESDPLTASLQWTSLSIQVWNRTVTQVVSTYDGAIRELRDLGSPTRVTIRPSDIFMALDVLLWPARQERTNLVNSRNVQWSVTAYLAHTLSTQMPGFSTWTGLNSVPRQHLCNTVLMPLFLFHSLYMGDANLGGAVESPQLGLGDAFYVPATYAYSDIRPTPAFWTIIAYASLGGFILIAVLIGQIWALWQYPEAQVSAFPLLDLGASLKVVGNGVPESDAYTAPEEELADRLRDTTSCGHVIKHAGQLRVVTRQP